MSVVLDAFTFGMGIGMNAGVILVLFLDAFENIKNAVLDIMQGEPNNQTKEDY